MKREQSIRSHGAKRERSEEIPPVDPVAVTFSFIVHSVLPPSPANCGSRVTFLCCFDWISIRTGVNQSRIRSFALLVDESVHLLVVTHIEDSRKVTTGMRTSITTIEHAYET